MTTASLRFALGLLSVALATAVHAADVTLKNAWMRPAPESAGTARAYVDIESSVALELVGAATPVARSVQIVRVKVIGDPGSEVVVPSLAVPSGATTRLAFLGDHLRLVGIVRDVGNGVPVPLTLTFRDGAGKDVVATTSITVRGLLRPQQMRDLSRSAEPGASDPPPGPPAPPPSAMPTPPMR